MAWRTSILNHAKQIAAADFFVVPTATCQLLFVLVILAHERRPARRIHRSWPSDCLHCSTELPQHRRKRSLSLLPRSHRRKRGLHQLNSQWSLVTSMTCWTGETLGYLNTYFCPTVSFIGLRVRDRFAFHVVVSDPRMKDS